MHKRNLHKNGYDFSLLVRAQPTLAQFVITNPTGRKTIDFANPKGVKELNSALLKYYYKIEYWDIPQGYLCPPIPGRVDYIHALADLLDQNQVQSKSSHVKGLDIGTGANLIYPIVGSQSYGWQFVGTDIDKVAVNSAKLIQANNKVLQNLIQIRHQANPKKVFDSVVKPSDTFNFSMCNPPFHVSEKAALLSSVRKNQKLKRNQSKRHAMLEQKPKSAKASHKSPLNFAGQHNELWCIGGEVGFIQRMIAESIDYQKQINWFTSLVSQKDSLKPIYKKLNESNVTEVQTIDMTQGSKSSRMLAWRF